MVDGLTPTQALLLRPWKRCFTVIISACWNLTSSKLKKTKAKFSPSGKETKATPEQVWICPIIPVIIVIAHFYRAASTLHTA